MEQPSLSEDHPKISVSSFECTQPSCRSRSKLRSVHVGGCKAEVYPCLEYWQASDAFGDMIKQQVLGRSISKRKMFFDGMLVHGYDDQLYKEPT
ncbi:hypothetical protein ACQY0O_008175 [Thecaphora frezii]